ncbi:MAG: single-stranded DNA-binding protein [Lachnospiraceae bacterium]|nr:single-stranded DNA-binding protein [Lachnospiraceae bacterium]
MNRIILMGRLTRDPEIRYSQDGRQMAIARYSLAVDKRVQREDGVTTDFFNIVAFDRRAEFAEKYLRKGTKILLCGHVQTGSYNNRDGVKIPFFEVVVDEQEFAESKNASSQADRTQSRTQQSGYPVDQNGFMQIPDDIADELAFD